MRGDADKLEHILDSLLTNAIQSNPSGTVRFPTGYAEGRLHVEVGDTGIGMDRETLERVFRPFERAAQEINPITKVQTKTRNAIPVKILDY